MVHRHGRRAFGRARVAPRGEQRQPQTRVATGAPVEAGEFRRDELRAGARVRGPAIVREALSTTLVCPGQTAEVGRFGELVIEAAR